MKKAFSLLILLVYIVFSQFAVKAVATTQLTDQSGDEIVCVTKKLSTLDWKQDCREKHNMASFADVFEYSTFLLEKWVSIVSFDSQRLYSSVLPFSPTYCAQAPPWVTDDRSLVHQIYAHIYVWTILLLD